MEPAPRNIPDELRNEYSLNGRIIIIDNDYVNEVEVTGNETFLQKDIDKYIDMANNRMIGNYQSSDPYIYQALDKFNIENKSVLIIGSQNPWYESICLKYKGNPTTVDFRKIVSEDKRISTLTVDEYNKLDYQWDASISVSSLEHTGLGRYGDPLDPNGDLKAMKELKLKIKKEGLLFLAVPLGIDYVRFNALRIYGRIRLPMLLDGWEMIDSFGYSDSQLDTYTEGATQPVLVLKNI